MIYWVEYRGEFGAAIKAESEEEARRIFCGNLPTQQEIVIVQVGNLWPEFCEVSECEEEKCQRS